MPVSDLDVLRIFWQFYDEQEIRSMERVSVQCVAFRMPKQVVMY